MKMKGKKIESKPKKYSTRRKNHFEFETAKNQKNKNNRNFDRPKMKLVFLFCEKFQKNHEKKVVSRMRGNIKM